MILPISIDRVNKITQLRVYLRNYVYPSNMNHMIDLLYLLTNHTMIFPLYNTYNNILIYKQTIFNTNLKCQTP